MIIAYNNQLSKLISGKYGSGQISMINDKQLPLIAMYALTLQDAKKISARIVLLMNGPSYCLSHSTVRSPFEASGLLKQ
ncbi:hypothetical protein CEXT_143051 [Caerostris extrusa]|uniref:Uncharacterized protein n=1 Tax=Caerostris extrusa TaxID=172846 RepID=A0AAV4TBV7_CAEEX|nr:hypothetical protein CEXT_143051 [Caerostris extrusa]